MSAFTEAHANVAKELANVSIRTFNNGGSMHPGTVVAATARMAGTYLFRSFDHKLAGMQPGDAVLSPKANEQTATLIRVAAAIVNASGIKLDDAQAGEPAEPQHQPRQPFLDTQRKLEPLYRTVTSATGMTEYEAARAAAVAAAYLIAHCAKVLEPNTGFRLLCYGITEGAKSAPDPVALPDNG
jgi:hypothetical protein